MTSCREIGAEAEKRAADFFLENGFDILETNYRFGRIGEIDIIAGKGDLIVFAEVKSRSSDRYGGARQSISLKKKKSFSVTARHYLSSNPSRNSREITCRFDMIAIEDGTLEWIQDIFR